MEHPTPAERAGFETNGYLVIQEFLPPDLVERLREAALSDAVRRRRIEEAGQTRLGMTHLHGKNIRLFYLLEDDPLFLDMVDLPLIMPYVTGLLNEKPHFHASDVILEYGSHGRGPGWHSDGIDAGFRRFGWPIPFLQLKVGYYLSDMSQPGAGNLCVVPGSHNARIPPDEADRQNPELFEGAVQICGPPGTAILFHNALWHTGGPWTREGERMMLYLAYEHPWMLASLEPCSYSKEFYAGLSAERRELFHPHLFRDLEQGP